MCAPLLQTSLKKERPRATLCTNHMSSAVPLVWNTQHQRVSLLPRFDYPASTKSGGNRSLVPKRGVRPAGLPFCEQVRPVDGSAGKLSRWGSNGEDM